VSPSWAPAPTEDDVRDAGWFLQLLDVPGPITVDPTQQAYQAKDLLRAARLPVLSKVNAGVRKWTKRLRGGDPLPPVLLLVGSLDRDRPLIIAEGYHRVCACYLSDEQTMVECHFLAVGR
jgi:hypothetical protein